MANRPLFLKYYTYLTLSHYLGFYQPVMPITEVMLIKRPFWMLTFLPKSCAVALTCPEGSTTVTLAPPPPPTATCNPSMVGGQIATPTDGTCTASSNGLSEAQQDEFAKECDGIRGSTRTGNIETGFTCTFPSTPPT
jgi:hypothetical protein